MANNRMYLKHEATGKAIMLGKRMAAGYYKPPSSDALIAFFDECEEAGSPKDWDDFVIEFQIEPGSGF